MFFLFSSVSNHHKKERIKLGAEFLMLKKGVGEKLMVFCQNIGPWQNLGPVRLKMVELGPFFIFWRFGLFGTGDLPSTPVVIGLRKKHNEGRN